ncbi:cupin domain-containing protein [Colwellia psychrerythraea]|uniref:Cupin 2 conserved barrel domain protein n=1 Tax=Colwellia psychrerythraea TaxID=28229 RepID=A0A099KAG1_COLPS|nr:cupin domain-containing protein [Colwellia psychrerythraea]KGJ86578.1 Cupin 2 conserved barrel domain protein [Colwellia psychrerythraea]
MNIRQIVTGHDEQGNSIFLSESDVSPVQGSLLLGFKSFELWSTKKDSVVPHKGELNNVNNYFPETGGSICRVITFPPQEESSFNFSPEAIAETKELFPGLIEHLDPTSPGMHTTNSIDYGIVLRGEIYLELDNGEERLLTPGSCVVQNGTRHAWVNKSKQPATMAFILLGVNREE